MRTPLASQSISKIIDLTTSYKRHKQTIKDIQSRSHIGDVRKRRDSIDLLISQRHRYRDECRSVRSARIK